MSEEGEGLACRVVPPALARIGDIAGNLGLLELGMWSVLLERRLRLLLLLLLAVPTLVT